MLTLTRLYRILLHAQFRSDAVACFVPIGLCLLAVGSGCAAIRKVADPVTGLVKRGSCISIDLPPITLTPERTAAERQLVGENRELEPNGWLLASAQSASRYGREGGRSARPLAEVQRLYRERAVLEYYADFLLELQGKGALGESSDGLVAAVPPGIIGAQAARITRADVRRALIVAREINEARQWIYKYQLSIDAKSQKPGPERVRKDYLTRYWEEAPAGTWVRGSDGRWIRRQ